MFLILVFVMIAMYVPLFRLTFNLLIHAVQKYLNSGDLTSVQHTKMRHAITSQLKDSLFDSIAGTSPAR